METEARSPPIRKEKFGDSRGGRLKLSNSLKHLGSCPLRPFLMLQVQMSMTYGATLISTGAWLRYYYNKTGWGWGYLHSSDLRNYWLDLQEKWKVNR